MAEEGIPDKEWVEQALHIWGSVSIIKGFEKSEKG